MPKLTIPINECSTCHSVMDEIRRYKVMDGEMIFFRCSRCGHKYHRVLKYKKFISENGREITNVIWTWTPSKEEQEADHKNCGDMAKEYAIELNNQVPGGLVLWGRYDRGWVANPSGRPVIFHLLTNSIKSSSDPVEEIWKFCLCNRVEQHGDLISAPNDPFFTLKLLKKIAGLRISKMKDD